MGTLWATRGDLSRLAAARSAVLLVGGYDGSGNYGDVLQVATAIETVRGLPGSPPPVAIVEREMYGHHGTLVERYPDWLAETTFLYYDEDEEPRDDGLVELTPGALRRRSVLYVYGGGFLNQRWGGRKIAHAAAAERLCGGKTLPVVASGLQVDEAAVAAGGVAHELLSRTSWIGVRDSLSRQYMQEHLPGDAARRVELAGDDATPFLRALALADDPVLNLHVNDGVWVSESPDEMLERVVSLLCELARAAGAPLRLQPVIAYEDPRVSERRVVDALLERFGDELEAAGIAPVDPLDLLEDALDGELARFRRARLTVACSYHVTLTSLLAGIPALLLAENGYYDQKAEGLRDLFGLDDNLVGVRGGPDDAASAASVLVDGEIRDALLGRLRAGSARVAERYDRGREATATALVTAPRPRPLSLLGAIRRLILGG
jgi:polysaccharide pyruvyl transferase